MIDVTMKNVSYALIVRQLLNAIDELDAALPHAQRAGDNFLFNEIYKQKTTLDNLVNEIMQKGK